VKITNKYPDYFTFDVAAWFSNPENYAVIEGENIGFAEFKARGTYWVHFCFHTARGKDAVILTKNMLLNLFNYKNAKVVVGLICVDNRKAIWVARQSGLKSLGKIETENGLCEMFYSTNRD